MAPDKSSVLFTHLRSRLNLRPRGEMADTTALKAVGGNPVRVRVSPRALSIKEKHELS